MYHRYQHYSKTPQNTDKYRVLPAVNLRDAPDMIDFSSNDYLALSRNPQVLSAALDAGKKFGVGATGSRLLSGNHQIFDAFEAQIAKDKKLEAALIFNSGFQANIAVLSSLLDTKVLKSQALVFADKWNHASLYQGIFLAQAELVRYRPQCMIHLRGLLEKYRDDPRPKFIVTETVFGMDGSTIDLESLKSLCQEHQAFLYLDEAHATGLFGDRGYGLSTTVDLTTIPHLIMGTFSKALGVFGAYVAGPTVLKNFLINKCAGFIYTTALSPMVVAAAAQAWALVPGLTWACQQLMRRASDLRHHLQGQGFDTGLSTTHIIPLILGQEADVLKAQQKMQELGILVSAIRPPSVAPGKSRLRLALNVNHTAAQLDQLQHALKKL